jgi:glutamate formiminotransferase
MAPVIIEAVPNFSEGRRRDAIDAIAAAVRAAPVKLLNVDPNADHNRCVVTFVGEPAGLAEAAFAAARKAAELIDLTKHEGQHPRMGALDVLPFIPIRDASMADAVALAVQVGRRIGEELGVPVFLYESAATRPDRRNLADVRKPQFEGLRDLIGKDPDRAPDFGPNRIHPTAGCTAVGARMPLIAYNVDLETEDVGVAKKIAKRIRERDGGLPGIKALGLYLADRKCAQVSINVCDYTRTGLLAVFQAVEAEAGKLGAAVRSSEVVGLLPAAALPPGGEGLLRLAGFSPAQILDTHLE